MEKRAYKKAERRQIFAKNLYEAMKARGITQGALADILSTTQQTISRWCKGICEPDYDTLILICGLLGESPDDLLEYEEQSAKKYISAVIIENVAETKEYKTFQKGCADRYLKKEITLEEERELETKELKRLFDIYCKEKGLQ